MKAATPNPPSVGVLGNTGHFTANLPQIQEEEEDDEDAMEMSDEDD